MGAGYAGGGGGIGDVTAVPVPPLIDLRLNVSMSPLKVLGKSDGDTRLSAVKHRDPTLVV